MRTCWDRKVGRGWWGRGCRERGWSLGEAMFAQDRASQGNKSVQYAQDRKGAKGAQKSFDDHPYHHPSSTDDDHLNSLWSSCIVNLQPSTWLWWPAQNHQIYTHKKKIDHEHLPLLQSIFYKIITGVEIWSHHHIIAFTSSHHHIILTGIETYIDISVSSENAFSW